MRTFHIGGTASGRVTQSSLQAKHGAKVRYQGINVVTNRDGNRVAMNRNGFLVLVDENGREREKYQVTYGATLLVKEGETVERGQPIARVGRTGNASTYHLHFEVRLEGNAIDSFPQFQSIAEVRP